MVGKRIMVSIGRTQVTIHGRPIQRCEIPLSPCFLLNIPIRIILPIDN